MNFLYSIGIDNQLLQSMLEIEPNINDLSDEEILIKIDFLKKIKCTDSEIVNIISCNPHYLNRTNKEIIDLINILFKYNFNSLNILLDSNPFILNLDSFEIKDYINKRLNNNELLDIIIDELDSNPLLFNEI